MSEKLRYTVLGCGSSPGVPRIHGDWGACDPKNPKNRRLRCSLLVQRFGPDGVTTVVVDTSPDFREQMLAAEVKSLDGVLYTHPHADHIHGIDDLRGFALAQRERIDVYADEPTNARLIDAFGYCFVTPEGSMYPPILNAHLLQVGRALEIEGKGGSIHALPVMQTHGPIHSLGFRFSINDQFETGGLCYSSDLSDLPKETPPLLQDLDCWIVDALQYREHISHFSLSEALEWIEKIAPKTAFLTHMHIPLDYETVKNETPAHIEPCYDGLVIEV